MYHNGTHQKEGGINLGRHLTVRLRDGKDEDIIQALDQVESKSRFVREAVRRAISGRKAVKKWRGSAGRWSYLVLSWWW